MLRSLSMDIVEKHEQKMDELMDVPPGGYDVVLTAMMPRKYKCPLCNYLMRAPIQTYRGEMACESCYTEAVRNSKNLCPIDEEEIDTQKGEFFFKDNHARREVLQLQCYCTNRLNKCEWKGPVSDLEAHSRLCEFKEITCNQCNGLILRKNEEHHTTQECKLRNIPCRYCGTMYNAQSLSEHEGGCHLKPMKCPYDCGESLSMENIFQHVGNCSAINRGKICPYSIVGCKFEPRETGEMQNHMMSSAQDHAALTITLVTTLNESNKRLRQDLLNEQSLQTEMAKKMEEQTKECSALTTEIEKIKEKLYSVQQEGLALAQACEVSEVKIKDDIAQFDARIKQDDIQSIQRKVDEIRAKYVEFEVKIRSGRLGGSGSEGSASNEIRQVTEKINQLETGSALLAANLADLELKLQLFENTSYSGRQLWKVDNVMYRMQQAVTGKVTALHGAPCFQSKGGYKFCTRLYLNGDGMGRGTHVSLFFVLMKSEHDALLKWPFTERVTFRLINPYNRAESLKESFIPDHNSSSFKQPSKDMNVAAGCPMFLRKDKLPQFIIDDVIFIECFVGNEVVSN